MGESLGVLSWKQGVWHLRVRAEQSYAAVSKWLRRLVVV